MNLLIQFTMPELIELPNGNHDGQFSWMQEVHHQINNNLQVVNSLINLQRNASKNNMEIASLEALLRRINTISIAHTIYYEARHQPGVNIRDYIKEVSGAIDNLNDGEHSGLSLSLNVDELIINLNYAIALGIITSELLTLITIYAKKGCKKADISISLVVNNSQETIEFSIVNSMAYDGCNSGIEEEKFAMHLIDIFSRQIKGEYYLIDGSVYCLVLNFKF